jgi:hypothetical protein
MHDSQVEEQVRRSLRAEGDRLPLTITTAELERRLAARRRESRGRWVSFVAAAAAVVAVVAIVGIGNGWLGLPSAGTQASPSPTLVASPTPTLGTGISQIARAPEGRLVLEIEPISSGSGIARTIHRDLEPDDYVVSVKVLCVGRGIVSFTERTHTVEDTCIPVAAPDSGFQPEATLVPISNGSLDMGLTVTPGIDYTVLIETVPHPDHLTKLKVPEGAISMETTGDRPTGGGPGTSTNKESGRLDGSTEWVEVVCLGPGVVTYTLGPVDRSSPDTSSETVCDGVPRLDEITVDFTGDQVLSVAADSRVAWQVVATRAGPLPVLSPTGARAPLGRPDEAILVRPDGDAARPDSFEVTRLDPLTSISVLVATVPGTVLPPDARLVKGSAPIVSLTGWLAIPVERGTTVADAYPAVIVVDLTHPVAPPVVFDRYNAVSWDVSDGLNLLQKDHIDLAKPGSSAVTPLTVQGEPVDFVLGGRLGGPATSTTKERRFIATQTGAGSTRWGAVGLDGVFTPATDLPAIFQRTGLERPAGVGAHTLGSTCDGGAVGGSGCALVETDATGAAVATWVTLGDGARLYDDAWAANGRQVWLLLDGGTLDGIPIASLAFSTAPGTRVERTHFNLPADFSRPAIQGIASEGDPGHSALVAIGDAAGFVREFVGPDGSLAGQDGTAWFAGWAGAQPDYDPD